jgi:mono/diheme cytochrome c family protein
MRTRLSLLVVTIGIAVVAAACGRASETDILSALGITPTATLSSEQAATSTAAAISGLETRTAAQASIDSGSGSPVALAEAGDVAQGKIQFQLRCLNCHRVAGTGTAPALVGPANPAVPISDQGIFDLVRTGEGHAVPPGPLTVVTISDRQLINIIAFIRDQSK